MKVAGIVLIVWGGLAVLAAILQVMRGFEANFAGLSLIVLGTFLISRAKKKQEEKNTEKVKKRTSLKNIIGGDILATEY